jgi:hypothetical protein
MEIAMTILTIGKRLISLEEIAYVEPFDPAANPEFKPEKDFKARLVLLNRDIVLSENSPQEFAEANGFHLLAEDNVAVNPSLAFKVETFAPTDSFKPGKAYRTRIKWRDANGNEQSKLLVMEPETVVAELSQRGANRAVNSKRVPRRPAKTRRAPRNVEAAHTK